MSTMSQNFRYKRRWVRFCETPRRRNCPAECLAALAGAGRLWMSWRSASRCIDCAAADVAMHQASGFCVLMIACL